MEAKVDLTDKEALRAAMDEEEETAPRTKK